MNVYDFTVKDREGHEVPLSKYRGKALLIVNTATGCHFTTQYKELQSLYEEMKNRNFEILDFPCNQFLNQAPGTNEEIYTFCTGRFGITFPQFGKVEVIGENADPLFKYLQSEKAFDGFGISKDAVDLKNAWKKCDNLENVKDELAQIRWNFTKFLVDSEGNVVARYEPTEPMALVRMEVNRLLNGEELSIKKMLSRKAVESESSIEKKLFRARKQMTLGAFLGAYGLFFLLSFLIIRYVRVQLTPIVMARLLAASVPGAVLFSAFLYIFSQISERQINRLSYALEQATKGNYNYRLITPKNSPIQNLFNDYNTMAQTLKDTMDKMEEAVADAEAANQAKSNFLSNMSHEIRTPLNAVLGMDEMIIRECSDPEILAYANDIKTSGRTLLSLINDILDISKVEAGKMEIIPVEYDLSSVINDLLNMTQEKAKAKNLKMEVVVDETMPHILYGDEVRVKQVCLNILNNAVKYTDAGSVTMTFSGLRNGDKLALHYSVKDTGQGIKQEDMARLFEPFSRIQEEKNRHVEGTGLGVSITKNLLEMMGSRLEVDSTFGVGSDFYFTVEQGIVKDEPIGNFAESYRKSVANNKKYQESFRAPDAKLLVVDDVEMNLTVVRSFLKKTLVQIDTVTSGGEALSLGQNKQYDLIFVDHMMPDMDGFETLEAFRKGDGANSKTPIVILTANAVSGAREQYMAAGFDDYLTKPIDSDKLEACIVKYLPPEKVLLDFEPEEQEETELDEASQVLSAIQQLEGIDVAAGIKAAGGRDAYLEVVKSFVDSADSRIPMIEEYFERQDYKNYTIQVHALKSSARLVGQMALSSLAESLEAAGNASDQATIEAKTPKLLQDYRSLVNDLAGIAASDEDKPPVDEKFLKETLQAMKEALSVFDVDTADAAVAALDEYAMPDYFRATFKQIKGLMADVRCEEVAELLDKTNIN